jgi:beta-galactosidase
VYDEFSRTAHELQKIGGKLVNFKRKNDVAIVFSKDSFHGILYMPFSDSANYMSVLNQMHQCLYRANTGADLVTPDSDFSGYKVLFVPPLYVASDATLAKISRFVENGGHVVMSFKSGFTNEYDTVRAERAPGPLRKAAGFSYQEFSNLKQPLPLKGDPLQAGSGNKVSTWAEMIQLETAKPLAFYDHPFFGKYPALTRNEFGRGTLTYEGTLLSDELQGKVIAGVLGLAGLPGPDQQLPAAVRVKSGTGNGGHAMHYYMNYSGAEQRFPYSHGSGTDLLTGKAIANGQAITLAGWDLAIIEEK